MSDYEQAVVRREEAIRRRVLRATFDERRAVERSEDAERWRTAEQMNAELLNVVEYK